MLKDPAAELHPPGSVRVRGYEDPPCGGDSGSGPHVIRDYRWKGGPDQLWAYYQAQLQALGWTFATRETVIGNGREYEQFVWEKSLDGYPVRVTVSTAKVGQSDLALGLSAEPQQDCS